MRRDSTGQNGYVRLVWGHDVPPSGHPDRIYVRLYLTHPSYRSLSLTPDEARRLADELNRMADGVYFWEVDLMESPPDRIAPILEREPEIAEAVKRLRTHGYEWPALEGAVWWSEAEGRLSVQRVNNRARYLTNHPELIQDDRYFIEWDLDEPRSNRASG